MNTERDTSPHHCRRCINWFNTSRDEGNHTAGPQHVRVVWKSAPTKVQMFPMCFCCQSRYRSVHDDCSARLVRTDQYEPISEVFSSLWWLSRASSIFLITTVYSCLMELWLEETCWWETRGWDCFRINPHLIWACDIRLFITDCKFSLVHVLVVESQRALDQGQMFETVLSWDLSSFGPCDFNGSHDG